MPSNINHAGPGRAIYMLPIDALSRQAQLAAEEGTREIFTARSIDQVIDLRVDWDGDASHLGRFEVMVDPSTWQACGLLDPYDADTDMIVAPAGGTTFHARFQRGPDHKSCTFGVKAVPITWKQTLPEPLASSYVAQRGTDYEYQAGIQPDLVPWTYSVPADGVHRLTLELSMAHNYEMWVRLQHPDGSDTWQIQDPIIRPIYPDPHAKMY
jgi:hypothetical protein